MNKLYLNIIKNIIEKEKLNKDIKDKDIFEHYIGKKIVDSHREYSMYNKEDTPSQYIYYNKEYKDYMFKDFSSGKGGKVYEYVAHKYFNGNIEAALKDILSKLVNNEIQSNGLIHEKSKTINLINYLKLNRKENLLDNFIPINSYKSEYFMEHGINNIWKFGIIQGRLYEFAGDNICYLYTDNIGTPVQLYCPNPKKFHTFISVTYNIDKVNKDTKAIIRCSSIKDTVCMQNILNQIDRNIIAITNLSEHPNNNIPLPEHITKYVIYDNDSKGIMSSNKLTEYGYINLTKIIKEINTIHNTNYKDVADICRVKKTREQLKQIMYEHLAEIPTTN